MEALFEAISQDSEDFNLRLIANPANLVTFCGIQDLILKSPYSTPIDDNVLISTFQKYAPTFALWREDTQESLRTLLRNHYHNPDFESILQANMIPLEHVPYKCTLCECVGIPFPRVLSHNCKIPYSMESFETYVFSFFRLRPWVYVSPYIKFDYEGFDLMAGIYKGHMRL